MTRFKECPSLKQPSSFTAQTICRSLVKWAGLIAISVQADFAAHAQQSDESDNFAWELSYTGEFWSNVHGGLAQGGTYLDNLDITFESKIGGEGALIYGHLLYNNAGRLSDDLVGDVQGASNIDTSHAFRLFELWYQHNLSENFDYRIGLYDLNSEFDVINSSRLFINSSHGIGPDFSQSGANGPSVFPVTSLALRVNWLPRQNIVIRAAVLDAVPGDPDSPTKTSIRLDDGALAVAEAEFTHDEIIRFAAGYWRYSKKAMPIDTSGAYEGTTDDGMYVLTEASLPLRGNPAQFVSAFLRLGWAEDTVNRFKSYAGAGLTYRGFSNKRLQDEIGFAVAHVKNGDPYMALQESIGVLADSHETAWELTYRTELNSWLTIQPNIQFIVNPDTEPDIDDSLVFGVRFEVKYGR